MNATKVLRTTTALTTLAVGLLMLACSHEEPPPQSTTSITQATPPPPSAMGTTASPEGAHAQSAQKAMRGRDPAHALLLAASQLQLTDAQSASLRAIQDDFDASGKSVMSSFRTFNQDLAAQVRAGAIEPSKLQGDESAIAAGVDAHVAKETDVLNRLHATLDAPQRQAAAASVRGRLAEMSGAHPSGSVQARRLDRMTRDLGLDATQQQQVLTLLASQAPANESAMAAHKQRTEGLLAAFTTETFDASTALGARSSSAAPMVRAGVERRETYLSKLLPILRPEQRDKLATQLEMRAKSQEPDHDDDDDE